MSKQTGTFDYVKIVGVTKELFIPSKLEIYQTPVSSIRGFGIQIPSPSISDYGTLKIYPQSPQQEINLSNLCRGRRNVEIKLTSREYSANLYNCIVSSFGGGEIEFTFDYYTLTFEETLPPQQPPMPKKLLEFDDGI